jgi:inactivated superfamily I helicase
VHFQVRSHAEFQPKPAWLAKIELLGSQAKVRAQAVEENGRSRPISADDQLLRRDPREELRGIPVIARGVTGARPETSPVAALLRKQPREPL